MTTAAPPAKIPFKQRALRIGKRLLRSAILMYLIVCMAMYALQTYLIFPGASLQGTPEATVTPSPGSELLHLKTADSIPLTALFIKADPPNFSPSSPPSITRPSGSVLPLSSPSEPRPSGSGIPTILYFYGNGQSMASADYESNLFLRAGANCLLIDYPGYGMSGGKPSEQGCYAAAEAAYQYLLTRPDIDTRKLIPAGWSLGGAVAIDLAYKHKDVPPNSPGHIAALITFSSFTSMLDMAKQNYPFLPVGLLLAHHFKSEEKLRELAASPAPPLPYFLGHGKIDSMIPFTHADRLAAAYSQNSNPTASHSVLSPQSSSLVFFACPTADHNDFFDQSESTLLPALTQFLAQF